MFRVSGLIAHDQETPDEICLGALLTTWKYPFFVALSIPSCCAAPWRLSSSILLAAVEHLPSSQMTLFRGSVLPVVVELGVCC